MTSIVFRKATRDDLSAIIGLLADDPLGQSRETRSDPPDRRYIDAFRAIDDDPNQLLAVADDDGTIAGCLQLTFLPGLSRSGMWRGQIESVRVADAYRGKGLGRSFFEWAIGECKTRGCGLVQATSDKSRADAIRFYESLGFEASHEGLKLSIPG